MPSHSKIPTNFKRVTSLIIVATYQFANTGIRNGAGIVEGFGIEPGKTVKILAAQPTVPAPLAIESGDAPFSVSGIAITRNAVAVEVGLDAGIAPTPRSASPHNRQLGRSAQDHAIKGNRHQVLKAGTQFTRLPQHTSSAPPHNNLSAAENNRVI